MSWRKGDPPFSQLIFYKEGKRLLFVVDMQNDFVDNKRGLMAVPGGEEIVPGILARIKKAEADGETVVYTLNDHHEMEEDLRSQEEKNWGHELYGPLKEALKGHVAVKKGYYAVHPEKLMEALTNAGKDHLSMDHIELVGVDTAVCVLSNAVVLRNLFPDAKIIIRTDMTRAKEDELGRKALDVMKGLSMEVL
ncbi:Nicotinamidase-related amidase [Proteiniclasticum ruminis]|uniref:Nicotinamidase-related amidase n=1 Tax=Proteiniclasticum ruminis TaxID=398199 RepID=A0A1I5EEQ1_9CLOT|nr:Nicotinamidase-related amidase [Proteiniclasticum ruminis]